jgi:hypothetical protein
MYWLVRRRQVQAGIHVGIKFLASLKNSTALSNCASASRNALVQRVALRNLLQPETPTVRMNNATRATARLACGKTANRFP